MSEVNRRALLARVGGVAAIGIAGGAVALAAGQSFSPEFVEYLRCVQAHIDHCDAEPAFGSAGYPAWDAASTNACEARHAARMPIQNRPLRCWQHFVELALVVHHELWDQFADGTWDKHSINDELEIALQTATFWLIEGGANV